MANIPNYACSSCQSTVKRETLIVKKALFTEMGEGANTVRSRVVAWLCPSCLQADPDYQREKFSKQKVLN